ncbi:MAG: DUF1405 domain-containing protein [Thermoflexales bacterium]|nr:DUF1405 domain-containing protein [Thermoflexales bacterium]MDW8351357.1 DUF1405 domain-containing protein [Anaerolineae bacterium]
MRWIRGLSDWVIRTPATAWLAFGACVFAFVFGTLGWYGAFFGEVNAPWWAYPFIPDCPLAALMFGIALVLMHLNRTSNLINQLAAVFCIKYGVWTMSFWALYWLYTGEVELSGLFSGPVMFVTHLGLTIMGLLLLQYVRPGARDTLIAFGWFILSDVVDYAPIAVGRLGGYGYYPPLPWINGDPVALVPAMLWNAVVMTWLLNGALLIRALMWRHKATQHPAPARAPGR